MSERAGEIVECMILYRQFVQAGFTERQARMFANIFSRIKHRPNYIDDLVLNGYRE